MIVDTHVHVVSGNRKHYAALPDAPEWPVTEVDALVQNMDALGIDRALLVQTFFTYGTDNRFMIDCAQRHARRLASVCVIDQTAQDAPQILTDLVTNHAVSGVRLMPKGHSPGVLSDPGTFPVWERATELGIVVTVAAELEHLHEMPPVIARFPEVKVCFEHMWGLEVGNPPYLQVSPLLELAAFPNVNLKLCPNNSYAARAGTGTPRQFFGMLIDSFGIHRLLWGSNYPAHTGRFGNLEARLRIMQDDLSFLGEADRCAFFGENALRLWPVLRAQS